jgi:hypothetical protein
MKFIARSSHFKNLFPANVTNNFKMSFLRQQEFDPSAKVYLLEAFLPPVEKEETICLIANIVSHSQIGEQFKRVLRIFNYSSTDSTHIQFPQSQGYPLAISQIETIRFSFKSALTFDYVNFKEGETFLLLEIA